jgi:two-component system sensor histidine kinase AlgZ
MSATPPAVSAPSGIVIPDCCNIGVVFRVLVAVNAAAFTVALLQSESVRLGLLRFVEASMVIELACLWSLFALCGLRQFLRRSGAADRLPPAVQRVACVVVPAAVTGAVVYFFTSIDWLARSLTHVTVLKGALTAALLSALLQHYFSLRTRAYSPALVEARLQALQARIRPHFLFNSLNAVLSLIRTEPRRAETTLEDLADLFRVLMSDPRNMTTLENEVHLCKQYLSIEKIRLGERLQVNWDTDSVSDDVLRKAQLPVLLLQPLLENAVHYGVEPVAGPVLIQVHIGRSLDRIEIMVANPYHGPGPGPALAGNHMALDNIRERLALLYDVEAQLATAVTGGFFEVRMRFPYMKVAP